MKWQEGGVATSATPLQSTIGPPNEAHGSMRINIEAGPPWFGVKVLSEYPLLEEPLIVVTSLDSRFPNFKMFPPRRLASPSRFTTPSWGMTIVAPSTSFQAGVNPWMMAQPSPPRRRHKTKARAEPRRELSTKFRRYRDVLVTRPLALQTFILVGHVISALGSKLTTSSGQISITIFSRIFSLKERDLKDKGRL